MTDNQNMNKTDGKVVSDNQSETAALNGAADLPPKKSEDKRAYERWLYAKNREKVLPKKREANKRYLASEHGRAAKSEYRDGRREFFTRYRGDYYREYYKKHPERLRLYQKRKWLKKLYGLSIETWQTLIDSQNGKCAICACQLRPGTHTTVDHDHSNGKVRGILCSACNKMIGYARDKTSILQNAIQYLERHK